MTMFTTEPATTPTVRRSALVLPARLRRLLNGWVAAAIAYRERQVALLAQRQLDECELKHMRIYRGPIDEALEKVARLRKRPRLKQS
jgi:hypothetical protein